ncbi:MAG: hydantoinase/oxoprolinase family protein [Hyphomicrobiales bacterium]|nr:hydantoinase/oxoprolinase family protein [Hyphomicrobiales bacterium]
MTPSYRIGIDVGGTFTDIVAIDGEGAMTFLKTPTTPENQAVGVVDGIAKLAKTLRLPQSELLRQTTRIVHGTTVATNALLERKGARVALLTTAGHRDVLEMREGLKLDRYDLRTPPPEPLVPREKRFSVIERLRADGSVATPLDKASLVEATRKLKEEAIEAIAVCYLHSYRNSRHEKETFAYLRQEMPEAYISLSSEVLAQIKEYERVSTTVVNAYVGPGVRAYFAALEHKLAEAGYTGTLYIILSHGGVAPIEEASRLAAATVLSGPAGGVAGCRHAAHITGDLNLIPFDMGGTSTDISLIVGGEAALSSNRGLAGQRIALRSLDIISIGAGGGSIARAEGGALDVGPQSAGAFPGPVCYGTNGTEPTVTDANVVLGTLSTDRALPGREPLDKAAADRALDQLAKTLGLTRERTAEGIVEVINVKMADGIRLATVSRGVDPRDYALFSFGGAAGLHACDVARGLDISRIIVPNFASVLSAWGMLSTPLRYEVSRTHIGDTRGLDAKNLRALYDDLAHAATLKIAGKTPGEIRIQRSAEMRYGEQIYEIDVPLDDLDWESPNLMDEVTEAFRRRHEALFTYSLPDQDIVLVNARVAATSATDALPELPVSAAKGSDAAPHQRRIYLGHWREVPVYPLDALVPRQKIAGPALIEAETTTVLLKEGDHALVNRWGWLDIAVAAR